MPTRARRVSMSMRSSKLMWGDSIAAWLSVRLIVTIGFAAAEGIRPNLRPGANLVHLHERLLTYDASWYLGLSSHGYGGMPRSGLRFFPLYHVVSRWLAWPIGGRNGLMLVVVANLCAFGCLLLIGRLVVDEFDDESLAKRSIWLLALFPAAGSFVFAYSESMMLLLTLALVLAVRRRAWVVAIVLGVLAGLCRPLAVLLVIPLAVEVPRHWSRALLPERALRVATIASPGVGALAYLFYVGGTYGDWLEPVTLQRGLRHGFQDPATRLWDAFADLRHTLVGVPNLAFALGFLALILVMIRRQPPAWTWYAAVTWIVAMSAHNIDSIGRYGLVAFPFVIALAQITRSERAMWIVTSVSSAALGGLTVLTLLGRYVP